MLELLSRCLRGQQPTAPKSPPAPSLADLFPEDDTRSSITSAERQWQALYDGLHTVQGAWHERMVQVMELVAACCGTALVSAHLLCPYHSCFVVISSGGPQAEVLQSGDLQQVDLGSLPANQPPTTTNNVYSPAGSSYLGSTACSASASLLDPNSLQLLLKRKVTICSSISPSLASLTAAATPQIPADWRRIYNSAHLTDFAAVPILDAGGAVVAALTFIWPVAAVNGGEGRSCGGGDVSSSPSPRLSAHVPHMERFAQVLGLAFFSDLKWLSDYLLIASMQVAIQRAETLQSMVEAVHEGFGTLLERQFRLEGARCVLALSDSMEARVAYFGPPEVTAASTPGPWTSLGSAPWVNGSPPAATAGSTTGGGGGAAATYGDVHQSKTTLLHSSSSHVGGTVESGTACSAAAGGSPPLQGVLGPLVDTLLQDVVSQEGVGNGRVVSNCRTYLQLEDKPGRDVQVCFQLCRLPPACLVLAVGGAVTSTLAPDIALYVCTAQQQLPKSMLEDLRTEVQKVLQLLMPLIHRQLLGQLSWGWTGMRLQAAAAAAGGSSGISFGGSGSLGGGNGSEGCGTGSIGSALGGFSSGGVSLGGLYRTCCFSLDDLVSHSPAHLKVVVAGIQSTITTAQMNQAWLAAGDSGTRESIDDLYSIRLRETVGQGGQGVVFRGLMHGLEVAVKVVAKDMPGALIAKAAAQQQQQAAGRKGAAALGSGGGGGGGGGAAAAGGVTSGPGGGVGVGAPRTVDPEHVLRTAKRELIRDALELAVTSAVNHPHIVQVYNYFFDVLVVGYAQEDGVAGSTRSPEAGGTPANGTPQSLSTSASNYLQLVRRVDTTEEMVAEGPTNLVIVMEYCDAGTLKDALRRGYFKCGIDGNGWPRLDLAFMYISLLEVALALRHMHSLALVHCDVKPSNVLLRSHPRDPRGWTCKLSDFGCVRMLRPPAEDGSGPSGPHFTVARALGTLTHMAPEVISKGAVLTSSVDIYSFGIMMAELASGVPQDQCMPGKEAIQMARKGIRPTLPPFCPKEYRDVATACWSHDPHVRPTAAELVNVLLLLLNQVQGCSNSSNLLLPGAPQQKLQQRQLLAADQGRVAAARGPAGGHRASDVAALANGRPIATAALTAAAMQHHAALLGVANIPIVQLPLQQQNSPPTPAAAVAATGAAVGSAAGCTVAEAAAALAFPGLNPSQVLATVAERVLVRGAPVAADATSSSAAVVGGAPSSVAAASAAGGAAVSAARVVSSALPVTFQQHLMLQQVHQQMQMHQQQQLVRQALQQQMAQALQQHIAQQQQRQQQLMQHPPQEQLHDTLELQSHQQLQQQQQQQQSSQVGALQELTQRPQSLQPPLLQALPPPPPQKPQEQEEAGIMHFAAAVAAAAAAASAAMPTLDVHPRSSNSGASGGAAGATHTTKPGSFSSAASAFSAIGAASPSASSVGSAAQQLNAQILSHVVSQPLLTIKDITSPPSALPSSVNVGAAVAVPISNTDANGIAGSAVPIHCADLQYQRNGP